MVSPSNHERGGGAGGGTPAQGERRGSLMVSLSNHAPALARPPPPPGSPFDGAQGERMRPTPSLVVSLSNHAPRTRPRPPHDKDR